MTGIVRIAASSDRTQVCLSVVQAMMIDVVNNEAMRDVNDEAVHFYVQQLLGGFRPLASDGIKCTARLSSVPSIFGQARIVIGINDSEFSLA